MGFLGLRKKENVVDLSERYRKQQNKIKNIRAEAKEKESVQELQPVSPGIFGMFGGQKKEEISSNSDAEDKRKKLAKRLMDMTDKIEDLSNQIFSLQQRIEIIESKIK